MPDPGRLVDWFWLEDVVENRVGLIPREAAAICGSYTIEVPIFNLIAADDPFPNQFERHTRNGCFEQLRSSPEPFLLNSVMPTRSSSCPSSLIRSARRLKSSSSVRKTAQPREAMRCKISGRH